MAFRRRLVVLFLVACAATFAVWLRVGQLQVLEADEWAKAAQQLRERSERPGAPRGRIVDREGAVLAEDAPVPRLTVVPWEWQRRGRARCAACGTLSWYRPSGRLPRRCACRAPGAPRPLAEEEPADLEMLLGLEPGTLRRATEERIARIHSLAEARERALLEDGDDPFLVDDKVKLYEEDMLRRPFVVHDGDVPEAAVRRLELDEVGRYRGYRLETTLKRVYPDGDSLPQLLGYTQPLFQGEYEKFRAAYGDEITLETRVGRRGLERAYDGLLRGHPGRRRLGRDDDGAFTVVLAEDSPQRGLEVRLSTSLAAVRQANLVLERFATPEGFAPGGRPSAAFVAMEVETGEIVAWGEAPRYDVGSDLLRIDEPEWTDVEFDKDRGEWMPKRDLPPGETVDTWRSKLVQPDAIRFSRVAEIPVEPGSTMKPVAALAMLESGAGLPWEAYTCTGGAEGDYPRCHHAHGTLDAVDAMAVSCNRWWAMAVGDSRLTSHYRTSVARYVDRLGFGHTVFADLLGGWGRGLWLRPKEWSESDEPRIGKWDGRFVAIGQGPVTVTPLHVVRVAAALANGGRLVTPHVVRSVGGTPQRWPTVDLGVAPASLALIRSGMRQVVTRGTASDVAWDGIPAAVYAKTGTAQVGGRYDPQELERGPWHHWFMGFAESPGRPTIAFCCLLYARTEEAAGLTAAPATAAFLEWWYAQGVR